MMFWCTKHRDTIIFQILNKCDDFFHPLQYHLPDYRILFPEWDQWNVSHLWPSFASEDAALINFIQLSPGTWLLGFTA